MENKGEYIHRDLSWCDFNERVLAEAEDPGVPLLDRIKFLSIFSSNLDEFYRVKVAGLKKLSHFKPKKVFKWLGYDPARLLSAIYDRVNRQQQNFGIIWSGSILPQLREKNIVVYQSVDINTIHHAEVDYYFRVYVQGYLRLIHTKDHKKVHLENQGIYLMSASHKGQRATGAFDLVNIPSNKLPRFIELSAINGVRHFIMLDDIIRLKWQLLFPDNGNNEAIYSLKLNRDEDYEIEDEFTGNLIDKIKDKIEKRMDGSPVRFLYDEQIPRQMLEKILKICDVDKRDAIAGGKYHNMNDLIQLTGMLKDVLPRQKLKSLAHQAMEREPSVLAAMNDQDFLLHFPYHNYDPVIRFFNEAAIDPGVSEIKVTLYRISRKSRIANALISAALNGKKVTVFVEVKARYDELNNIQWAREMEKAGVSIIYSLPGLKVHAKVALVIKKPTRGKKSRYAYLATGNFNEKTASLYSDHGFFTTNPSLCKELERLFNFLRTRSRDTLFGHLLVSGFNMKKRLLELIDEEIEEAKNGNNSFIIAKMNGLDEPEMINKLYEASEAGVKVQLLVRGGCSLVPGKQGFSENINAYRLVDMFLEHARVYWFCMHDANRIYLSSADWMDRNLNRRIEVAFPINDAALKEEIMTIINYQLADNVKLTPIGDSDMRKLEPSGSVLRAQSSIHKWIESKESAL